MLSLSLLVLSATQLLTSVFIYRRLFNPLFVFNSVWFSVLLLYEVRYIDYYDIDPSLTIYLFEIITAFFVGIIAGKSLIDVSPSSGRHIQYVVRANLCRLLSLAIFLFAAVSAVLEIREKGGIASYIALAPFIREQKTVIQMSELSVGYFAQLLNFLVLPFCYLHIFVRRKIDYVLMLPIFTILVNSIINFGRADIVLASLVVMNTYLLTTVRKRREAGSIVKVIGPIFLTVMVIFFAYQAFRHPIEDVSPGNEAILGDNTAAKTFYFYVTGSLPAFSQVFGDNGVFDDASLGYGLNLFGGVAKLVQFAIYPDIKVNLYRYEGVFTPMLCNIFTVFRELILDFGMYGSIWAFLAIGVITGAIYEAYLRSGSRRLLIILVVIFTFLEYSVFYSAFGFIFMNLLFVAPWIFLKKEGFRQSGGGV